MPLAYSGSPANEEARDRSASTMAGAIPVLRCISGSNSPMPAVELHNVTKTFGPQLAVNDLTLAVPEGSVYGFIGPNGSGKTTTLRMIMRIIMPDRGSVRVLGEDHPQGAATDRVGY